MGHPLNDSLVLIAHLTALFLFVAIEAPKEIMDLAHKALCEFVVLLELKVLVHTECGEARVFFQSCSGCIRSRWKSQEYEISTSEMLHLSFLLLCLGNSYSLNTVMCCQ